VDRANDIGRKSGITTPVVGWEAVRSLVTDVGLADPEDAVVNSILESLRVTRDLQDEGEEAVVAVVSGAGESAVGRDRALASGIDTVLDRYDVNGAIVVVDSAADERAVPIVESRLPVDSVDRVIVRQARDIESTYYLLKQFMGDEELRETVLVPVGIALILLPFLLVQFSLAVALAGLTSLLGAALLYYGLGVDEFAESAPERAQEALYSGQVSVVTYVVAVGLAVVGVSLGIVAATGGSTDAFIATMQFVYRSVPWLAAAALTASFGRLLDELIRDEGVRSPYLNLPFGAAAVGLVIRGFAGWFLERRAGRPHLELLGITLSATQRLALFIVVGIVLALIGVRVSSRFSEEALDDVIEGEPSGERPDGGEKRSAGDEKRSAEEEQRLTDEE
jgi:putative membrane protein